MFDDVVDLEMGLGQRAAGAGPSFKTLTETRYFAQRRAGTKEQVFGIDGMDSMVISTVGQRHRGVRSSELARSQAWELRQKIKRNQEAQQQGTVRQQQQAKAYALQKQQEKEAKKQQDALALKQFQHQQSKKDMEFMPIHSGPSLELAVEEEDNTAW